MKQRFWIGTHMKDDVIQIIYKRIRQYFTRPKPSKINKDKVKYYNNYIVEL